MMRCHHTKGLHDTVSQYFPNDQCRPLKSHAWIKDAFKVPGRPMDRSIYACVYACCTHIETKYKRFPYMISDSSLQITFKKLPLNKCSVTSEKNIHI